MPDVCCSSDISLCELTIAPAASLWAAGHGSLLVARPMHIATTLLRTLANLAICSGTHEDEQEAQPGQVQGPMPPTSVHAGVEGHGEGGEAQAESASEYVRFILFLGGLRMGLGVAMCPAFWLR